jgi:MFS family permease
MIESFVRHWQDWAGAKLLAGMGVGCIQSTLPIYITEWAPVNIRGAMLLAYSVLNNVGGFIAPLLLNFLQKSRPTDYKTSILTQCVVCAWIPVRQHV